MLAAIKKWNCTLVFGLATALSVPLVFAEEAKPWTLESSVLRALEVAPEVRAAQAEIEIRQGELIQAGAWPNPTIQLRADDKLGQEDGRGGTDLTEVTVSQSLPLLRLPRQRSLAQANLSAARELNRYQQLVLENQVARTFHGLQLAKAKKELAESRLQLADRMHGSKRDPLIRYLSPLERMRLNILKESAKQTIATAEVDYRKTETDFKALLALTSDAELEVAALTPVNALEDVNNLLRELEFHPVLAAARKELEAASAGVEVARSQRFADPELNIFRGRDFLDDSRENVTGIGLSIQVPLWNFNNGIVDIAKAEVIKVRSKLEQQQRDLNNQLVRNYVSLRRLIVQAESYQKNLLEPSERAFELTRRGFLSGELNILALVDANNTYFDAYSEYLKLLQAGWLSAADLRLAAGISLLKASAPSDAKSGKGDGS